MFVFSGCCFFYYHYCLSATSSWWNKVYIYIWFKFSSWPLLANECFCECWRLCTQFLGAIILIKLLFPSSRDVGISYCRMLLHDTMLMEDSFRTGTSDSPLRECGVECESVEHFLLCCLIHEAVRKEMITDIKTVWSLSECKRRFNLSVNLLLAPRWENQISKKTGQIHQIGTLRFSHQCWSEIITVISTAMLRLLASIYCEVYNLHRVLLWILLPRFSGSHFTLMFNTTMIPDALWST